MGVKSKVQDKIDSMIRRDTRYGNSILSAMQSKPMYMGSVERATIQKRRAKNKRARVQRRVNRCG